MGERTTDDEVTGRDLRTIWRTVAVFAIAGAAVAGAVFAGIVREVKQDTRIEALEAWRAQVEREKRREEWRRERVKPTQFRDIEVDLRFVEVDGKMYVQLPAEILGVILKSNQMMAADLRVCRSTI